MKFTLSWLKEHLNTTASLEETTNKLTDIGLEVEEVINSQEGFIISKIIEVTLHPDSDHLNVCKVDSGTEILEIVCGAHNVRLGMKSVLALIGSTIPTTDILLKKTKIRGIVSNGMLCSEHELGMGEDHDGIIDLDSERVVGESFFKIDPVVEIAITPNRGDCLGVRGIARDLAASGIGELKPIKVPEVKFSQKNSPITLSISDSSLCSCFIGCYIQGVKNNTSPKWIQERLKAVGIESISALVDITNYLTLTFNRPMHVYDADKLSGNLTIRLAKQGESFQGLNRKDYALDDTSIIITDEKEVVSLAGIMGSQNSCCSDETSNIFLEVALFDEISLSINSQKLGITTEASYRFVRGLDSDFTLSGAKLAIDMITSLCGGEAYQPVIIDNVEREQRKIPFNIKKLKKITGCDISEVKSLEILKKLGFSFQETQIIPPTWRNDIEGEADIAEEILRIDGYHNIPETPLPVQCKKRPHKILSEVSKLLREQRGMNEVITWSFMDSKKVKEREVVKIKNPISENFDVMRPFIIPNLFDVMLKNFARDELEVAIFEIGAIYSEKESEEVITGLRSGLNSKKNIYKAEREYDLFDAKADVIATLEEYNIHSPELSRNTPDYYHPGRSGCFMLGKIILAYFGELIEKHKSRVMAFEIFVANIPAIKKKNKKQDFSVYQAVERDFAFVLKEKVTIGEIIRVIQVVDKKLIKEIDLFDVYRGDELGEGNKSVAISVKLQASDRTLTGPDIEKVHTKIIENIYGKVGGILRKDYQRF